MQLNQLTAFSGRIARGQRVKVIGLAVIAASVFLVFITRVELLGTPREPLRSCTTSDIYKNGESLMTFTDMQRLYHYTMEQLLEERMRLYEGRTLLSCTEENMETVIPSGDLANAVAQKLPYVREQGSFSYADFELLLTEFWRTYDCQLFAIESNPGFLREVLNAGEGKDDASSSDIVFANENIVEVERERARRTLDRLLTVIRSSEEYLPLHASLRCLQRGATDVRNSFALLSDASQCLPAKLTSPETSLLQQ